MLPELQGKTPVEVFGYINTLMREDNTKTIQNVCSKSINKKLWEGTFLTNAQRLAHGSIWRSANLSGGW